MGRIAGLPTRYVEGYLAQPDESGTAVLTGQDAHAWVEIYFNGIGWIPFDATNGSDGHDNPDSGNTPDDDGQDTSEQPQETPDAEGLRPEATPTPEPTVEPDGGDSADSTPEPELPPDGSTPGGDSRGQRALWIALAVVLLILLALLAALWVRGRLKRADPVALCRETKSAQQAAAILYRANLTALGRLGQFPTAAETPEAFAARISKQFGNPDYEAFVRAAEPKRTACTPRAASTPARRSADESPDGRLCRSLRGVAGTSMCRSMRSSSGPEIFAR